MGKNNGKTIAVIGFIGGATIIRSLMRSEINTFYFSIGALLLLVAIVLFIKQIKNMQKRKSGKNHIE